jgi:Ca2+-transporting ATPase
MITGDHPFTARKIAADVGMDGQGAILTGVELDALSEDKLTEIVGQVSLYARTTPEHKLRIVRALQRRGDRVAVTGDGVNDAPALVAADIGVAMGETGTDVAREASDIVLADDNFSTIVRAVNEGRALFANLTKGVRYYLACKVALVLATLVPTLLRVPVPFAPVQIILMELFMDLAASAAFVAEPPEGDLMHQKPRDPTAPFIDKAMIGSILTAGIGLFAAVTAVYLYTWYRGAGLLTAQTAAFVTWLLGHVLLALNMRSERQPIFQLGLFSNRVLDVWGLAALAFVLLATLLTPLHAALKTTSLSGAQWALIPAAVVVGTFWMEVRKLMTFKRT